MCHLVFKRVLDRSIQNITNNNIGTTLHQITFTFDTQAQFKPSIFILLLKSTFKGSTFTSTWSEYFVLH